jgi:hypothetical protein
MHLVLSRVNSDICIELYAPCKQIKKKYNITDEREALYTALKLWTAEIEVHMLKLALTT